MNNGSWDWLPSAQRVDLHDCLVVADTLGRIDAEFATRRGFCSYPVERTWFLSKHLRLGNDEGFPLRKQD